MAQSAVQKRDAMEARLQKVRDRKRAKLGLPPKSNVRFHHSQEVHSQCLLISEDPILPAAAPPPEKPAPEKTDADRTKEAEEKLRLTLSKALPQTAKVRPWDFGKEGVPSQPKEGIISHPVT